ncbi:MAG: hypothetical protein NTW00_01710 [Hyphomicrobiales bacterium]|nr:hypothetical protein [Hyphomicrobiales bacterium]
MFAPSMRTVCGGQVLGALVLGALVQGREGQRAAEKRAVEKRAVEKLLRKLIRKQSRTPRVMVTDKPGSDGAARTGMGRNVEHRQHMGLNHMGLNNRAKNAHLPTLRRKRIMKWIIKRFTSVRHLKRLDFVHDGVANLYTFPAKPCRHPTIRRCEPRRLWRGARLLNRASPRSARGQRQGKSSPSSHGRRSAS